MDERRFVRLVDFVEGDFTVLECEVVDLVADFWIKVNETELPDGCHLVLDRA